MFQNQADAMLAPDLLLEDLEVPLTHFLLQLRFTRKHHHALPDLTKRVYRIIHSVITLSDNVNKEIVELFRFFNGFRSHYSCNIVEI